MASPRLQGQHFLEIHEFSTGIYADGNYDDWISRGFTGAYMNATIDLIPNIIEIAIANGLFQTVGWLPHQPAIIGRVLQGKNEQWSVVAVVTIGKDGKGRSLSVSRYFLAEGIESISAIVAWLEEEYKRNGHFSIFNPFEIKQFGDVHKVNIEIPEPMPLGLADLNWLNEPLSSVTRATAQVSLQDINDLAYAKSQLNQKPISWAYNIYSLKQPKRFQIIHPINDASRLMVQQQLDSILNPQMIVHSNSSSDSKVILRGLISSSELRSDQIEEFVLLLSDPNQDWQQIFDSLGAIDALSKKIYVPNMIRLIALQAIAIPHTLITVLDWLRIDDKRQRQQNQQIFFNLQWQLRPYIDDVRGNLILGIVELIISLYSEAAIGNFTNSSKYIFNYLWLLDAKDSLWSSLKDEVITAFLEKVLVSATNGISSDQAWQDFIQTLLTANATVNRSTLAQPIGWRDFYVGIRDYASKKQNDPKYVYLAELFEQLGSGQRKNFLSRAKESILGVGQLFIFIIAIILVIIFDHSFAANISRESWLVSMFAPLAGLASVSLITRSFISALLVGIPHINFIRWRLCLSYDQGFATAALWTFLILLIWLIYKAVQSLKKSNAVNGDTYALTAVFYTISHGTVSQNVYDNAVKSKYTSNRKVQGFTIARAKTIDDSLIRIVKKIQLQGVIIGLTIVAVIFTLILGTHKGLEFAKIPSPFAPILSYNPNCGFPPPSEIGNWETTRKEIKSIVDENIQGDNKSKALYSLLDTLGGERLVGNVDEKSKYFYKGAIEEARQDPKLIQNWTDLIFTYQISKQKDFPDIIASGSISRGDRTSELIRQELKILLEGRSNFETTRLEIKKLVDQKAEKYRVDKIIIVQKLISVSVFDYKGNMADLVYEQVIDKPASDKKLQVQQDRWIRLIYNYENRLIVNTRTGRQPNSYITPMANGGTTIIQLSSALEFLLSPAPVSQPQTNNYSSSFTNDITDAEIQQILGDVQRNAFPVETSTEKSRETIVRAFEQELGVSSLKYPTNVSDTDVWRTSIKDYFDRLKQARATNAAEANLKTLTIKVIKRSQEFN